MLHVSDWFIPIGEKIKLSKINYKSDEKVFVFAIWQWETTYNNFAIFSKIRTMILLTPNYLKHWIIFI